MLSPQKQATGRKMESNFTLETLNKLSTRIPAHPYYHDNTNWPTRGEG